jgi:type IV secretory pathway VirB4 component
MCPQGVPLTCTRDDIKKQLASLAKHATIGSTQLLDMTKQIQELQTSINVTPLSQPAQDQLRTLLGLSSTTRDQILQKYIRKGLEFPGMHDRSEAIESAHQDTYKWFFDNDDDTPTMTPEKVDARKKYSEWLQSGSDIFHVAGKLGSGKSTLIKYLCDHSGTRKGLSEWAGKLCPTIQGHVLY